MTLDRITAIVRQRYETGAYGGAHFRVAADVWQAMREATPPAEPAFPVPSTNDILAKLRSIPVVVDALPAGHWELVRRTLERHDVEVIESGRIHPPGGEQ